jgi:hypothetical protein
MKDMKRNNNFSRLALLVMAAVVTATGCQKMERPALGDFPQDTNPPGGPLKFYAAFDGSSVDSTRAVYGSNKNVSYVEGVNGKAVSMPANGYVVFPTANEFKQSTSFTIAFWMKKNGPNPAGTGTSFAFGVSTQTDIWTRQDIFLLFEDAGNPSSMDSAAAKFYLNDQWFEFVKTATADKRLPKLLNNQWHHLAFTFDASTSMLTTFIDGAAYTNLPAGFGRFTNNGGKVNLTKIGGVVVGGPGHFAAGKTPDGWMGNFNGQIDQFRLYNKALTAAEINQLFTAKQ